MILKVIKSKPTIEGAGVHLNRVFGFTETGRLYELASIANSNSAF